MSSKKIKEGRDLRSFPSFIFLAILEMVTPEDLVKKDRIEEGRVWVID